MTVSSTRLSKVVGARMAGAALLILAAMSLAACSDGNSGISTGSSSVDDIGSSGGGGAGGGSSGGTGGGSSGATSGAASVLSCAPGDFTVAAGANPRELVFDWDYCDESEVDHYRVEVNPDGVSGYTVLAGAESVATTGYTHATPVHLTDWVNALYRVVAVDVSGNEESSVDLGLLNNVDSEGVIGYFKASNTGTGDRFANLSLYGDTLAVGAPGEGSDRTGVNSQDPDNSLALDSGAVYVFTRGSDNVWEQQAYLKASNAGADDRFGTSVSLYENTLAVGAIGESSDRTGVNSQDPDNGNATGSGAVYVFTRDGNDTWSEQAYIKASTPGEHDHFGNSMSLNGDTLVVGADEEDSDAVGIDGDEVNDNAPDAGAVYVFTREGDDTWSQKAYIKASNTDIGDRFGHSVSLSADTLAIGAFGEDSEATEVDGKQHNDAAINAGAVYVFTRNPNGNWNQRAYIKASNAESLDLFGRSVSVEGDTLVVGAIGEDSDRTGVNSDAADNSNASFSGAVYVFTRDKDRYWSEQAYIKASNTEGGDVFGYSVSLHGDTLAVGANQEDSVATGVNGNQDNGGGETQAGAVYVFIREGNGAWTQASYVKATNPGDEDAFGYSVDLYGDMLAVGASEEDSGATGVDGDAADNTETGAGAVYLY